MSRSLNILGTEILPGKSYQLQMDIARLSTRTKVEVPIIIERAKKDGPILLLLAGIHGDEVNGVEIVRQLVSKGYNKPTTGTVIAVPVLNVFGFINETREFPDGRDLNRMFPGSEKGSLPSRFAFHFLKEVASKVDYCIDYHTGGGQRFNYAHVRVEGSNPVFTELAKVFGTKFIMYAKQREHSFRYTMSKLGKITLLFEGGKSKHLDRVVTSEGINGALRIMSHLGIRDFSGIVKTNPTPSIIIKDTTWIRARYSGMYRSNVKIGEHITKDTLLGSISDPFGLFEKPFKSKYAGYVLNLNHTPLVHQGDALMNIGFEK